ncbi:MAG: hypothetical protein HKN98_16505 [Silicimonas sp.]|nr:hypothetical protein [Silicimonas sp.]
MSQHDQSSLKIVGAIAAGIFLVSMLALMVLGDYGFFAALFLSVLIALLAGIVIYLGFGGSLNPASGTDRSASPSAIARETTPEPASAPTPAAASEQAPKPKADPKPDPAPAPAAKVASGEDYDGDGVVEGVHEGTRPSGLDAPRDGNADDLKQIKGIGPKLEKLCNSLGFWHFDQVAAWTADEVAWVDANLQGFKGRVSRDDWVAQAQVLASGGETDFSKRVEDGDVY